MEYNSIEIFITALNLNKPAVVCIITVYLYSEDYSVLFYSWIDYSVSVVILYWNRPITVRPIPKKLKVLLI